MDSMSSTPPLVGSEAADRDVDSEMSSSDSSSASNKIPGNEIMRRSILSTCSSLRTRLVASLMCWQRREGGMFGRKNILTVMS